jgi:UDP:flavonoid glycosyltransferase YjiC (YdhE family)
MHPEKLQVLISPLDWGLGHAARCIPVIRKLLAEGHKVTLAGKGRSVAMLQKEFPQLECLGLDGFSPSYSRSGNMILDLFLQLPAFIFSIVSEHYKLRKLIAGRSFDVIISDNRYGLWNKKIKSILITHQVMIKTPEWLRFAEYPVYRISRMMISRFDECWIPDTSVAPGLSGDLSHKYPLPANAKFIGLLSRFEHAENDKKSTLPYGGIVAVISGPEPQRSVFEDIVISQLAGLNQPATILRGKPETEQVIERKGKLTLISHSNADETRSIIASSSVVICRSGYSSAMDLAVLKAKALFVPTPGQTEQLYLAELYKSTGKIFSHPQHKLNLKRDIERAKVYQGFGNTGVNPEFSVVTSCLKKK